MAVALHDWRGSEEDPLLTSLDDGVLTLTINRPEARNAVNLPVATALGTALERASSDNDVRVLILTGTGQDSFCAGADLKSVARGERLRPDDAGAEAWGFAGFTSHPISKPIIAMVNGAAIGGGLELVLACDLAVAADTGVFGLPEVKHGIYPAAGGAFRLPAQVPRKVALQMILTGEPIEAERAYELGLVNMVVPSEQLASSTRQLAGRIAALRPKAVQAAKRVAQGIVAGEIPGEAEHWARSAAEWAMLGQSRR